MDKRQLPEACKRIPGRPQVGTCGFGLAQTDYARLFSCVEVQHTFYQPPQASTLKRWRAQVPRDFEFVLKAWQLITHDAKSPTYRRLKRKLSASEKEEAGFFRDTAIVKEAWDITLAAANALRAKTILFQCPASFRQNDENIANLEKFISSINRHNLNLCWEPRGDWDSAVVKSICRSLGLGHVVDPFVGKTTTPHNCYYRLHGRKGWRYQYEVGELEELVAGLTKLKDAYVFFNNSKMTEDALKFCELVHQADNPNKFLEK